MLAPDRLARASAVGLCAFAIACVSHEAIGHGLACLASDGAIERLSAVVFQCSRTAWWIDLGGPLGSLACAVIALAMLRRGRSSPLIPFVFAFAALWFAGQLIYSALVDRDDFAFVADAMPPSMQIVVRCAQVIAGALVYRWALRVSAPWMPARRERLLAWATAGIAVAASTLLQGVDAAALRDAVLESSVTSVGLLLSSAARRDAFEGGAPTALYAAVGAALLIALGLGVA
ncbi:hypothetical protein DWG18_09265 [Lysobacter sp. TY2-98]|uniref:hypothetical protein n=1 Tax=Lysobacter sp. TY2-98 TaxID=2290922 RepID=UPI000E20B8DB|nr:hypothetical protein [Lysobacter sp. TY2-98]AXK72442.1 hypothetical protein DWG18_09265 [Lysobacter sp. TY2-98]